MSEQTETPVPASAPRPSWRDRPRLLRGLLIASLALNLLVVSAVATRLARGPGIERMPGASQVQLVPRNFLRDLPDDKRRAALTILKRYMQEQRGSRQLTRETSMKLAGAISAIPYDEQKVRAVIAEFASQSGQIAARGGDAALEILTLLTAEERLTLAEAIRSRASSGNR